MNRRSKMAMLLVLSAVLAALGGVVYFAVHFTMLPAIDYGHRCASEKELVKCMENYLGFGLPATVTHPHMYQDSGRDPTVWMRFTIPPAEVHALKTTVANRWIDQAPGIPRNPPEHIRTWWAIPDGKLSGVRMESGQRPPGQAGQVWIIHDSSGTVFICSYSS